MYNDSMKNRFTTLLASWIKPLWNVTKTPTIEPSDRYALALQPETDYLAQFLAQCRQRAVEQPAGEACQADDEYTLEVEGYSVALFLDPEPGQIAAELIETATSVLGQLVAMDTAARAVESSTDYKEQLLWVNIAADQVELHYCSTIINTEWGAFFTRDETGRWIFAGLG